MGIPTAILAPLRSYTRISRWLSVGEKRSFVMLHCTAGCATTGCSLPTRVVGQKRSRLRIERLEQRLCVLQIGRVETFGKPAVDRCQQVAGFGAAALVAAETGEAHGSAQLPELGPLLPGDCQCFAIQLLGGLRMALAQQQLTFVPIEFSRETTLPRPLDNLGCLVQQG